MVSALEGFHCIIMFMDVAWCSVMYVMLNYYLQDENEGSLTSHLDTELGKKVYLWNEKFGIILTFTTMS